jgi:hypothetical protein
MENMMNNKIEQVAAIEKLLVDTAGEEQIQELSDSHLAHVGGGSGDPILY